MRKKEELALRREEKIKNKKKREEKILMILGFAALGIVLAVAVVWGLFNLDLWQNRELSQKEIKALFEDTEALPEEGDPLLGTWFYFDETGEKIHSKYIFTADGQLKVYTLDTSIPELEDYRPVSNANYRVRESAGELYVWAKEDAKDPDKVIVYDYKIQKKENAYLLTWEYDGIVWNMVRGEQ